MADQTELRLREDFTATKSGEMSWTPWEKGAPYTIVKESAWRVTAD